MFVRQALAAILILLLAFPAWTALNPIGRATSSNSSTVRGIALLPGGTIFSGDTIEVGPRGGARIALAGGGLVAVAADSRVRVSQANEKIQIELTWGRVWFSMAGKRVQGRLGDATVRSAQGAPGVGVIARLSPTKAIIAAAKGELVVSTGRDSKSVTLREGEGVEVSLALPSPPSPTAAPSPAPPPVVLAAVPIVILGVVVIVAASLIAVALNNNEGQLTDQEKANVLSGFRP